MAVSYRYLELFVALLYHRVVPHAGRHRCRKLCSQNCWLAQTCFAAVCRWNIACQNMAIANQRGGCHESKRPFELGKLSGGLGHVLLIFWTAEGGIFGETRGPEMQTKSAKIEAHFGLHIVCRKLASVARPYGQAIQTGN